MKKLLLLCLVLGGTAFADQVNCIKFKDPDGVSVGTYCKPFTLKAGTNITFTDDQLTRVMTINSPSNGYLYAPDYGTVGDGATDDTIGLQAGITAAATAQSTLFIPPGTYKITSQLNVAGTGRFIIQCAGDNSLIQFDGSLVPIALGSPDSTTRSLIKIRDCHFSSTSSGNGLAIDASRWTISYIEHNNFFGVNKCILHANVASLYDVDSDNKCTVSGSGSYCIKFDSTANENTVQKLRCATDANSTGVIVNTQGIKLYDVDVETGALIGIDVQASARSTLISGAWLEANQTNLRLASGAVAPMIIGSEISGGTTADITDNGATGPVICGVRKNFISQPCSFGSGVVPGSASGPKISSGTGSPEGAITASIGAIYMRTDGGAGTSMYVKESGAGNTGWVGK